MDSEKENIRLIEQNYRLMQENEYLKMLLDRLIPIPINQQMNELADRCMNIEGRIKKIENQGNNTK